jgi:hypothetical protein
MAMYLLAQATAVSPLAGLEGSIQAAVGSAVNVIFDSPLYDVWIWFRVVIATFLAINTFLFREMIALWGGTEKGLFKRVLFNGLWVWIVLLLTLNPQIVCELIFSTWEFCSAFGDQLLYNAAAGTGTLFDQLKAIADAVGTASPIYGNFIGWGIAFFIAALALAILVAIYLFYYTSSILFLYVFFPFFMGIALAGLMSKPTRGWFGSVLSLGMSQILKALLGKLALWLTLEIMKNMILIAGTYVSPSGSSSPAGAIATFFDRTFLILLTFIAVTVFGIILQGAVDKVAKVAVLQVGGGIQDLGGSLAGGALALAGGALRVATLGVGGGIGRAVAARGAASKAAGGAKAGLVSKIDKLEKINPGGANAWERLAKEDPIFAKLKQTDGFRALSKEEQNKFTRFAYGQNSQLSVPANQRLEQKIKDLKFNPNDPQTYRDFIKEQPGTERLPTPKGTFDARRTAYQVSAGQEVGSYQFASGQADALRYDVQVGNKTIPIFAPKNPDPTQGKFTTPEQVAKSLSALPESYREKIRSVNIEPGRNPEDSILANSLGRKDYRSISDADSSSRTIQFFSSKAKLSQSDVDGGLIQGASKVLGERRFGTNPRSAGWSKYSKAAEKDQVRPSGFANLSPQADFQESLSLYQQVKGTDREAEIRALLPERFKIFDTF